MLHMSLESTKVKMMSLTAASCLRRDFYTSLKSATELCSWRLKHLYGGVSLSGSVERDTTIMHNKSKICTAHLKYV